MKTTIEVADFEIKIEHLDDKLIISAEKDGEVVEEFELDLEEPMKVHSSKKSKKSNHHEEEEEEEDFDEDEEDEEDEEDGEDEEEEEESTLESFSRFIKRRKSR